MQNRIWGTTSSEQRERKSHTNTDTHTDSEGGVCDLTLALSVYFSVPRVHSLSFPRRIKFLGLTMLKLTMGNRQEP